jgi:hypothetical protein
VWFLVWHSFEALWNPHYNPIPFQSFNRNQVWGETSWEGYQLWWQAKEGEVMFSRTESSVQKVVTGGGWTASRNNELKLTLAAFSPQSTYLDFQGQSMRMMIPFLFGTTPLISLHEMAVIVKSQGGWFQARQVHNVSVDDNFTRLDSATQWQCKLDNNDIPWWDRGAFVAVVQVWGFRWGRWGHAKPAATARFGREIGGRLAYVMAATLNMSARCDRCSLNNYQNGKFKKYFFIKMDLWLETSKW